MNLYLFIFVNIFDLSFIELFKMRTISLYLINIVNYFQKNSFCLLFSFSMKEAFEYGNSALYKTSGNLIN